MSADNYNLIRKHEGKYVVSMGFASDGSEPEIEAHHPRFDTFEEADDYSHSEYCEYGVALSEEVAQERRHK